VFSIAEFVIPVQVDGGAMHVVEGLVDVTVGCITPAAGAAVVFFAPEVGAGVAQKLDGSAEAAATIEVDVGPRMVVYIFAIEDSGAVDFMDSSLDFAIGFDEAAGYVGFLANTHEVLGGAEVAASAEVGGMAAWSVGIERDGGKGCGNCEQCEGECFQLHSVYYSF
jgi:hypothetical protein